MSTKDQDRPNFTELDALRIGKELFGIRGLVQELPSERDRNFYLRTESGEEFVLKIATTSEERKILDFQNQAMQHLTNKGVNCPQVINSRTGQPLSLVKDTAGNQHFVRLLTYLPGKVLAKVNPHTDELLYGLGRFLGSLSYALDDFSHPATHRELYWDLKHASSIINRYKEHIDSPEKTALVEHFLTEFEVQVLPALPNLRASVVHNDGNDYNVIVSKPFNAEERRFGIIDFGDMVATYTVFEPAVATAYAILEKANPIQSATQIIGGYHSVFPLNDLELELLFPLICTRLAMSVTLSAYQRKLEPDNEYLRISEKPAWELLFRLKDIHPRFALYALRHACHFPPCPQSSEVVNWLRRNKKRIGSIVHFDLQTAPNIVFNLSVDSLEFGSLANFGDMEVLTSLLFNKMTAAGAKVGVGRYNEARLLYTSKQYMSASDTGQEMRTIHLGIDLFLKPGSPILAPLKGRIHSFQNNIAPLDYGPTIILEHEVKNRRLKFFTLYGNLSEASLVNLIPGKLVKKGDKLAEVGSYPTNGGWPPHLHFQLITDLLGRKGDFPGVALHTQREIWLSICPDPNMIFQIPDSCFPKIKMSRNDILKIRENRIGSSLSLHYTKPLNIVRGYMQYLYDDTGKAYLDAVNNVPHVGHSHPKVVNALQQQAAVLNTNTRYLHENLVRYAQRLCATLPEPLSICFFVNSGSEANELALRMAQAHTNQRDLIVIDGAYHGNTGPLIDISPYKFDGPGGKGAPAHVHKVKMPDTYRGEYRAPDPETGVKYANDVQEKIQHLKKEGRGLAAFICEPLLGCGGQIVLPTNYLREAFQHVRQAGGVCIVDEVQVGFGRVGTHFWGFQTQGVVPDIVTMGKPIGNGYPLGAVVTTPEIANSFNNGMEFFSTTGGNPVSCAVGMAVLDVIEEERLQENALKVGNYLMDRLKQLKDKYPLIGDVRGLGLFIGVELVLDQEALTPAKEEAAYIMERMKDHGVLIGIAGSLQNVLKIKPPMIFTKDNVDFLIAALDKILSEDFVNITA